MNVFARHLYTHGRRKSLNPSKAMFSILKEENRCISMLIESDRY